MSNRLLISGSLLLTVALLATAGCGGGGGGTPTNPATVRGTVVDDGTLEGVAGADVSIGTASDQTGQAGNFELQTQTGTRTLTISATGYDQLRANVTLQHGVNEIGTRYLQPTLEAGRGAVSGTVRRNGNPSVGATVLSGNARATTRADGTFSIYNLPAGSRAVTAVSADGQATGVSVVDVQDGSKTSGVTINLGLAPPAPPVL